MSKDEGYVLDFPSLDMVQVPVRVGGKKYYLREANHEAVCKWKDAKVECARFSGGTTTGIKGLALTDSLLVSFCLVTEDEFSVPVKTIRSWPDRIVSVLFDKVKEISNIVDDDETVEGLEHKLKLAKDREERSKNLPTDTTDSSE